MTSRRAIGWLVVIGVLLHASALARHHVMMLQAHLDRGDLVTQLSVICHSSGSTSQLPSADVPYVPPANGSKGDCPLCTVMHAAGVFMVADDVGPCILMERASERIAALGEIMLPRLAHSWPPSRGPPALV